MKQVESSLCPLLQLLLLRWLERITQLLAENGGPLSIATNWAKSLLYHMQFVKRRGSTNKKILVHDFEAIKAQCLIDVTAVVQLERIFQMT